jgi:phosphate acetyltransferase
MPHTLYLVPCGNGVGLTSTALGLVRALDNRGVRVAFCKPIGQSTAHDTGPERSTHFIISTTNLHPAAPVTLENAERMIAAGRTEELLERVMREFHQAAKEADVVIAEGLVHQADSPGIGGLNELLVKTLSAEVILVGSLGGVPVAELDDRLEYTAKQYGGAEGGDILGCIVNRVPAEGGKTPESLRTFLAERSRVIHKPGFRLIGAIPDNRDLTLCRTIDIARHLEAKILHEGESRTRRATRISLLARTVPNMLGSFHSGAILITPTDRSDVIIAVAMAALHKRPIAGLVLTGEGEPDRRVMDLCLPGLETGLPVLWTTENSWETATKLSRMSPEVPVDDIERVQAGMNHIASYIDSDWIFSHTALPVETRMSPAAFCYRVTEAARKAGKRIVLPEGDEPRTIRAASICAQRGIARCLLLGDPVKIQKVATELEIELPEEVEILNPQVIRDHYVSPLVEMRRHKGLTASAAAELLEDTVWLGTVMLALGEVDGLVSGALHSSANTIRPALQIIKTKPGAKVVSSVFFMCLPDQVLVYGDCAVNPDPDAETLADIAIQSADSAEAFGIPARMAMISYSTGESGSGAQVNKVREATRIAREKRPDLLLDGPLQYDAAAIADVAATKAPDSPVAGKATVFVFPDLNTGNTTYKAVQRSAHVISIGPMLQGLKRPVNDLSRGALVEDIVYTIAITAIQASRN